MRGSAQYPVQLTWLHHHLYDAFQKMKLDTEI